MRTVYCDYCGRPAEYVDSAEVYHGQSFGMIYLCRPCGAYVGVHAGTDIPKGRLANAELRLWKRRAHAFFDPLWRSGQFTRRNDAYNWLAKEMAIPRRLTHIGMFDVQQCQQAIEICRQKGQERYAQ